MSQSLTIGICGGTGSGKTTVARALLRAAGTDEVVFLQQDSYYRNLADMPLDIRSKANFDHPDALDNELFIEHLRELKKGRAAQLPVYDFRTHTRLAETTYTAPKPIIIIEGILIFVDPRVIAEMDIKVFVDTPDDIRFIRRLKRDIAERGRTVDSVVEQYLTSVRPMHQQFVESSKRIADVIIPEGGHNAVGIDLLSGMIYRKLAQVVKTTSEPHT